MNSQSDWSHTEEMAYNALTGAIQNYTAHRDQASRAKRLKHEHVLHSSTGVTTPCLESVTVSRDKTMLNANNKTQPTI